MCTWMNVLLQKCLSSRQTRKAIHKCSSFTYSVPEAYYCVLNNFKVLPPHACFYGSPFPQSDSGSGFPSQHAGAFHQQDAFWLEQDLYPTNKTQTHRYTDIQTHRHTDKVKIKRKCFKHNSKRLEEGYQV